MGLKRVGILSIGEMGFHWTLLLKRSGIEVLTYLKGRSVVTMQRAENAGARAVSMGKLVEESDLIVSVVIPSAAKRVAAQVARALARSGREGLLYLDANAISPMTAAAIEKELSGARASFIDGCIIGSAAKLDRGALVYLSGPMAETLLELQPFGFSVRILGPLPGQASAFKIVYAGLTKGLQALLAELLVGARKFGLLDEILRRYDESFPGLVEKVGPSIAALRIHAGRRAEEMAELKNTFRHQGLKAIMAPATQKLLESIASLEAGKASDTGEREGNLLDTLELFFRSGLLQDKSIGDVIKRENEIGKATGV